ncbi:MULTISPECIES: IS3 family transposase [Microvirga]|uniref:IS3 family transposase n=1 Tax=Microvirga TaxID=186650 RepID=UPI001FFD9B5A|nr:MULTISPECIES: IS3 family transposase [unclassified Microvirga]
MRKKRFSVEQIVAALKQAELGLPVADLIRQVGISEQTFYRWKKQYAGLESDQVRELSLDKAVLQDVLSKKFPWPALLKQEVRYVQASHGYSERRACALTGQHRSTQRKPLIADPRLELRQRMHEIVRTRVRYGSRRVHILLKREGWTVGRNVIYRLYREEGLAPRSKQPRRRKMVVQRQARCQPKRSNEAWSLDFVHDALSTGQTFRALTVMDLFTREGAGDRGRAAAAGRARGRGAQPSGGPARGPQYLFADNGTEFTGHLVDLWAYHHGTRIDFSRPGKPTDNAHIETFNGSLRDEYLNLHWFETIAEAKRIIEAWRRDYNESRPHMALGNQTPQEYALRISPSPLAQGSGAGES